MRTILKNGRILDPSQDLDFIGSVEIVDDQIRSIGQNISDKNADEVYDCTDLWIAPGLVDLHTHLCEPGFEHKETISSGTQAAAAGGYTTVCCMPNTKPPLDNPTLVDYILDQSASPEAGGVFVAPIGALTLGQKGVELSDLRALKNAGIVAASDVGAPTQDSLTMLRAMEFCVMLDIPIITHCEDLSLSKGACMNEGATSSMLGLEGAHRCAEEIMVVRNCLLALHTGCSIHISCVSTWSSVEMIRRAKYLGAPVTCEVTPHHLIFTDESLKDFNVNYKVNPPLRTQIDIDLLMEALRDGTVDCLSSDHSPHATFEVEVPFEEAPFGISTLESMVGVTLTHLTHKGHLTPLATIEKLSTRPAKIMRLEAGTLQPGETPFAQVTVIDPNLEWTFDKKKTFSKGKNTPYHGMKLKGKPVLTFCGGEIYRDAKFDEKRFKSVAYV